MLAVSDPVGLDRNSRLCTESNKLCYLMATKGDRPEEGLERGQFTSTPGTRNKQAVYQEIWLLQRALEQRKKEQRRSVLLWNYSRRLEVVPTL